VSKKKALPLDAGLNPIQLGDMAELIEELHISTEPTEVDPSKVYTVYQEGGARTLDLEEFLPAPRRSRGVVEFRDAASLVEYVTEQHDPKSPIGATLYADLDRYSLVAILNDHGSASPGWRDHRAILLARTTREWKFWQTLDGKLVGQVAFAEHIEQGIREIVKPAAADMLELAMTFEAETQVSFKSGTTLTDGSRRLQYMQNIDAKAGQTGQIAIPKEFELAIAPFEGSNPFNIAARLRYRIESENLKIGYQLDRPAALLEEAFQAFVQKVADGLNRPVMWGIPDGTE
jgi:uncharacterized protein YfdQ (DUF2303 family)